MRERSQKLGTLLFVRGLARQVVPVAVVWSAIDWWLVRPAYGVVFLVLTFNYLITWALNWVAPTYLNGPWRVRPWQTLILLANMISLPIVFYRVYGQIVWGFIVVNVLLIISLYVGTAIMLYFNEKLPMPGGLRQQPAGTSTTTGGTAMGAAESEENP
jgi:hypothetical protein